ncbi:MAG: 3-deoxy-manno-octulosonate cytidylyltransferase [Muribaculaceae bacterium]|nr:3-deoxy-manno-octulosonate cytidylyltransferase [Muribaculaceae bacterium]
MKIIAVIPARYKSSRFEGKPLADICGKLMIERVYLQACKVKEFDTVYVATDDTKIFNACKERGINVIMTSDTHQTGTDRIGEVAEKIQADLYVNIQGDEPLIEPETIKKAIVPFLEGKGSDISVTNLMTKIKDPLDLINNTVPKVIAAEDGRGVYLTRAAAPYPKGKIDDVFYYKQVCVYGFTPEALRFYCEFGKAHGKAKIEAIEDIEILRFIENGIKVQYIEVDSDTIAVDTPQDLKRVCEYIKMNQIP